MSEAQGDFGTTQGGSNEPQGGRSGGVIANTRRNFLNWILGTGVGALGVSILYPVARYLIPPRVEEAATDQVTLALTPRDIAPNTGEVFKFGSRPGIIVRTPSGELKAFDGMCTHLDCIVQYRDDISHIWCACHNGHYDLTGRNIQGPPPRPLEEYQVFVQGDRIVVSKNA